MRFSSDGSSDQRVFTTHNDGFGFEALLSSLAAKILRYSTATVLYSKEAVGEYLISIKVQKVIPRWQNKKAHLQEYN